MTETTKQHGGKRTGAGRKPLPDDQKKIKMTFEFSPDFVKLLKANRPAVKTIENAVRDYLSK